MIVIMNDILTALGLTTIVLFSAGMFAVLVAWITKDEYEEYD